MHRVSEETPYIRGKEKCPRRVPATSWHSSSLSWSSARFSGYQKHHKLFCMHSTAIAGRYSCCRHQCWGWSSHPQQLANRHGQDIAYDCCQLPPPTRCAGFFSNMKSNYSCLSMPRRNLLLLQTIYQGSTTMIIVPLTTIKQQLEDDCTRLCHIVTKNNEYLAVLLCKYLLIATYILQILIFALLSVELCRFTNEKNIEPIGTQHYQ